MNDWFTGAATILTGILAVFLYYWEQRRKKKDAAKVILQEIRRAEEIIGEYKEHKQYKFTKKIIATDSWASNIQHFVKDLSQDSRDKISDLYSTGAYLDGIIEKVVDFDFQQRTKPLEKLQEQLSGTASPSTLSRQTPAIINPLGPGLVPPQPVPQIALLPAQAINIQMAAPWKEILDEVSLNYDPIYNSTICQKLKQIAGIGD